MAGNSVDTGDPSRKRSQPVFGAPLSSPCSRACVPRAEFAGRKVDGGCTRALCMRHASTPHARRHASLHNFKVRPDSGSPNHTPFRVAVNSMSSKLQRMDLFFRAKKPTTHRRERASGDRPAALGLGDGVRLLRTSGTRLHPLRRGC